MQKQTKDRYELVSILGHGSTGVVHRAVDHELGCEVALKVMPVARAKDEFYLNRFHSEVRALRRLSHPNIVKILDSGTLAGQEFYAMELLADARPLAAWIADEGPCPVPWGIEVSVQLLDALGYCHSLGILHRDLKPDNVMVQPGPRVHLLDFSLVTDVNAVSLRRKSGAKVGTPRYMAPEVVSNGEFGPASDIWGVGAILYEMLTGQKAFTGQTVNEVVGNILNGSPRSVVEHRPELAPSLDGIITQFLERDIAARVQSGRDGMELLRAWLAKNDANLVPWETEARAGASLTRKLANLHLTGTLSLKRERKT